MLACGPGAGCYRLVAVLRWWPWSGPPSRKWWSSYTGSRGWPSPRRATRNSARYVGSRRESGLEGGEFLFFFFLLFELVLVRNWFFFFFNFVLKKLSSPCMFWSQLEAFGFVFETIFLMQRLVCLCQLIATKFSLGMCIFFQSKWLFFPKKWGVAHQVVYLCLIRCFSAIFGGFIHESFGCQDSLFQPMLFWGLSPPQYVISDMYIHCVYTSLTLGLLAFFLYK